MAGWGCRPRSRRSAGRQGLPDATKEYVSRKEVMDAITMYNLVKVKEEMLARAPKKLEEMARMDYRQQQVMSQVSLYNSRLDFRYQCLASYSKWSCKLEQEQYLPIT